MVNSLKSSLEEERSASLKTFDKADKAIDKISELNDALQEKNKLIREDNEKLNEVNSRAMNTLDVMDEEIKELKNQ